MENTLVSIIVPIYNVERYLERCLASIQEQSYKNIEVIMVDDGSTDKSNEIAEKYEKKDSRFKLIKKENGGVSSARNYGLNFTKGEFVSFIDSDDFIAKNFVSILLQAFDEETDIVIADYANFKEKNNKFYLHGSTQKEEIFNKEKKDTLIMELLQDSSNVMSVCKNMYRVSFLNENNLKFKLDIVYGEDQLFNLYAYDSARKVKQLQEIIYFHLVVKQSATQGYRKNILEELKKQNNEICNFLGQKYEENLKKEYINTNPSKIAAAMLNLSKCNIFEAHRNIVNILKDDFTHKAYSLENPQINLIRYKVIFTIGRLKSAWGIVICTKFMLLCEPIYRRFQSRKEYIG